jgi:membrane-bound acyltransferase YfiQ involved in biofilm formation
VVSGIACVFLVIALLLKVNVFNRFWAFTGVISYELYLVHMKVFCVYFDHVKITGGYSLYIFLLLVFLSAWFFNRLFDNIKLPQTKPAIQGTYHHLSVVIRLLILDFMSIPFLLFPFLALQFKIKL